MGIEASDSPASNQVKAVDDFEAITNKTNENSYDSYLKKYISEAKPEKNNKD